MNYVDSAIVFLEIVFFVGLADFISAEMLIIFKDIKLGKQPKRKEKKMVKNQKYALKCGEKWFSGFEASKVTGKMFPLLADALDNSLVCVWDNALEAETVYKFCFGKECELSPIEQYGTWTITVVNASEDGKHLEEVGAIWKSEK